ncbi:MAG TPA: hypothetical protein VI873_02115 [Candidatus Peribacteraceae bacterium]|nr:hypothetical protein [Candidatus Peribacteraceae bacterium]
MSASEGERFHAEGRSSFVPIEYTARMDLDEITEKFVAECDALFIAGISRGDCERAFHLLFRRMQELPEGIDDAVCDGVAFVSKELTYQCSVTPSPRLYRELLHMYRKLRAAIAVQTGGTEEDAFEMDEEEVTHWSGLHRGPARIYAELLAAVGRDFLKNFQNGDMERFRKTLRDFYALKQKIGEASCDDIFQFFPAVTEFVEMLEKANGSP